MWEKTENHHQLEICLLVVFLKRSLFPFFATFYLWEKVYGTNEQHVKEKKSNKADSFLGKFQLNGISSGKDLETPQIMADTGETKQYLLKCIHFPKTHVPDIAKDCKVQYYAKIFYFTSLG